MVVNGRNSVSKGMEAGKYRVNLGNKTWGQNGGRK